jgi:hypothetical protein
MSEHSQKPHSRSEATASSGLSVAESVKRISWFVFFPLSQQSEINILAAFLRQRLRAGNTFSGKKEGILISSPTMNEAFTVGGWLSREKENPLQRHLFYNVQAFNQEGGKVFDSEWKKLSGKVSKLMDVVKMRGDGSLCIPKTMRAHLNIVPGSEVALFMQDDNRALLIVPSRRVQVA